MAKKLALLTLLLAATFQLLHPMQLFAQNSGSNGVENFREVDDTTFNQINPLAITDSEYNEQFSTPGGILSRVLEFAFPIAGLILFVMIVWGGFEMVMGASDKKSQDSGRQRVTSAVIGFILLFVSYWVIQIVETLFGIKILF